MNHKISLTILFCLVTLSHAHADAETIRGRASVIDGDTIEIRNQRIRLHGIDAPESTQNCTKNKKAYKCGQIAAFALDDMIKWRSIKCEIKNIDGYGRFVGECFAGEVNINKKLVLDGMALAYRKYSKDYVPEEKIAQTKKTGLWAGEFVKPWDFRRVPTQEEINESEGCLIKGNINAKGKRLYHLPGTKAYGRTIIDVDKGERWFCTENDAKSAGWLKANP